MEDTLIASYLTLIIGQLILEEKVYILVIELSDATLFLDYLMSEKPC